MGRLPKDISYQGRHPRNDKPTPMSKAEGFIIAAAAVAAVVSLTVYLLGR